MDDTLSGKVVAITGAASGIGPACARRSLSAGARVVLVDRAEDRLATLTAELGPNAFGLRIDLTDPRVATMLPRHPRRRRRARRLPRHRRRLHRRRHLESEPDAWDRMLALNVNAVFRTVRAVLPHMVERGTATSS